MGCCRGISRFLLFALNLITFLIGLAFIVIGVIYEVGFLEITNHLDEVFPSLNLVSILLIVVGCIIFIISFLGCCGALRQNSCMLLTYAVILVIILLIQVGLAIYAFIMLNNSADWRADLSNALGNIFHSSNWNTIEFIQQTLECCGFTQIPFPIPSSCCRPNDFLCLNPFWQVCEVAFYNFIRYSMNIIGIVAISLAALVFIAAVIATCVARKEKT